VEEAKALGAPDYVHMVVRVFHGMTAVGRPECIYCMLGKANRHIRNFARSPIHKIAEQEFVIAPNTGVDGEITENRSSNPLFTFIFTSKNRVNGSLFRYLQKCNGIRSNNGIRFLYLRQCDAPTPFIYDKVMHQPPQMASGQ
jgi:hypothetical protein